jgi:hypothetical protein
MARSIVSNLSPKALGASGTFSFLPTELPFPVAGRGISEFLITLTDSDSVTTRSTGVLNNISRIRIRAGGTPIVDLSAYELAEFITQMSPSDPGSQSAGIIGGAYGLKNAVTFRIPFNIFDDVSEDAADTCQFPLEKNPQIELLTGASMTSSTFATVYTVLTDIKAKWSPKIIGQAMGVPASSKNFRVPLTEPGLIRAIGLATITADVAGSVWTAAAGFKRYRLVLAGVEKFNMFATAPFEAMRGISGYVGDMPSATTTTIPALQYVKLAGMLNAPAGHSFLEVEAGDFSTGTWTAATAPMGAPASSTEYVLWSLDNQ